MTLLTPGPVCPGSDPISSKNRPEASDRLAKQTRRPIIPSFAVGLVLLFVALSLVPSGSADHGPETYHYRSSGNLRFLEDPFPDGCSAHVAPPGVYCDPNHQLVDWNEAWQGWAGDWYLNRADRGPHHIRFEDTTLNQVMFKANGKLCVQSCWVSDSYGSIVVTINPEHFTPYELSNHPLPTSGYFVID